MNHSPIRICTSVRATVAVATALLLVATGTPRMFAQESTSAASTAATPVALPSDTLTDEEMALIRAAESQRIEIINKVVGSVIAVYGHDRQGGGSGVIIDPSGIALTNHHVIQGAGLSGLGGLDDGELYEWDLIGTDPGGDVAVIKMKGRDDFPFTPLGDSDLVRVGDWALAMGNPFLLAHDQVPTVTLGVVSGVERFQEGAGSNQLVYGNCIQIDSSINPGNSGGPLFNMQGEVIGINGRGSFRDRGRVNVGLGYAISSNQIRNFIPDLLATKIVEHGTLDASFSKRDGRVVCSTLNLDAPVAGAGLELGDELIEFEGRPVTYANQFKNIICTLPEDWPATLKVRKPDGRELTITVRLFGLPYNFQPDEEEEEEDKDQPQPEDRDPDDDNDDGGDEGSEDEEQEPEEPADPDAAKRLKAYLLQEHGVVLDETVNAANAEAVLSRWRNQAAEKPFTDPPIAGYTISDEIRNGDAVVGRQTIVLSETDGRFFIDHESGEYAFTGFFDGNNYWEKDKGASRQLTLIEAKTNPLLMQAAALSATLRARSPQGFGRIILDGGDKTAGRISSRIMYLDNDDDWLYVWFSQFDEHGNPAVRLQKISADRDCMGAGGILFSDWGMLNEISLPRQKQFIRGLDESVVWTAVSTGVEVHVFGMNTNLFSPDKE